MKLSVDFKALAEAVLIQNDFIGSQVETWTISPSKEKDSIKIGTKDDRRTIVTLIEGDILEGKDEKGITVGAESLLKLMKVRSKPKTLLIRTVNDRVDFVSKTAKEKIMGCMDSIEYKDISISAPSKKSVELKSNNNMLERVKQAVQKSMLSPLLSMDTIDIWFRFDAKSMQVCAYDSFHMCYIKDGNITVKNQIDFAVEKQLIAKFLKIMENDCILYISNNEIIVKGEKIAARASSLQAKAEEDPFESIQNILKRGKAEKKRNVLVMGKESLLSMLDSLSAPGNEKEIVEFSQSKNNELALQIGDKNRAGYIRITKEANMNWNKDAQFQVDKELLKNILTCIKESEFTGNFSEEIGMIWSSYKNNKDRVLSEYVVGMIR